MKRFLALVMLALILLPMAAQAQTMDDLFFSWLGKNGYTGTLNERLYHALAVNSNITSVQAGETTLTPAFNRIQSTLTASSSVAVIIVPCLPSPASYAAINTGTAIGTLVIEAWGPITITGDFTGSASSATSALLVEMSGDITFVGASTHWGQALDRGTYAAAKSYAQNLSPANVITVAASNAQYTAVATAVAAATAAGASPVNPYVVQVAPGVAMTYTPAAGVSVVPMGSLGYPAMPAQGVSITNRSFNTYRQFAVPATNLGFANRMPFTIVCDCTDLRFVFNNIYSSGTYHLAPNTVAITVAGSIVWTPSITNSYEQTAILFNGQSTITIQPGGTAISDPIPFQFKANQVVTMEIGVTAPAQGNGIPITLFPVNDDNIVARPINPAGGSSYVAGTPSDLLSTVNQAGFGSLSTPDNSGHELLNATYNGNFFPSAILGVPTTATQPRILIIGDSLTYNGTCTQGSGGSGTWDTSLFGSKFQASFPYLYTADSGVSIEELAPVLGVPLGAYSAPWRRSWKGYTSAIVFLGVNDFAFYYGWGGGLTATKIENALQDTYDYLNAQGTKVYGCTLPPTNPGGHGGSSSNGWTTVGGQTLPTDWSDSIRVAVNTWIKANTTLAGVIDFAAVLDAGGANAGKWVCPGGVAQTTDGVHLTAAGQTLAQTAFSVVTFNK